LVGGFQFAIDGRTKKVADNLPANATADERLDVVSGDTVEEADDVRL
jgi:hypothetical protein